MIWNEFHFEFEIVFPQLLANYLSLQFCALHLFLMARDLVTCPSLAANAERGRSCKKPSLLLLLRRWNAAPNTFLLETHSSGKWHAACGRQQAGSGKRQVASAGKWHLDVSFRCLQ